MLIFSLIYPHALFAQHLPKFLCLFFSVPFKLHQWGVEMSSGNLKGIKKTQLSIITFIYYITALTQIVQPRNKLAFLKTNVPFLILQLYNIFEDTNEVTRHVPVIP